MTTTKLSTRCKLLTLCMMVLVSACGGAKNIVTEDDSANYKSARALPPLKKDLKTIRQPSSSGNASNAPQAPASDIVVDHATGNSEPRDSGQPAGNELAAQAAPQTNSPTLSATEPVARIVTLAGKTSRMEIAAELEDAWQYLSKRLINSNLTIHNRNRDAARIAIGCGNLASATVVKTSGGWSIFNRKQETELEYCALQLEKKKGNTQVKVLNRNAVEVDPAAAEKIFQQILAK